MGPSVGTKRSSQLYACVADALGGGGVLLLLLCGGAVRQLRHYNCFRRGVTTGEPPSCSLCSCSLSSLT